MQPQPPPPGSDGIQINVAPQPTPFQPVIQTGHLPNGEPVVIISIFTVVGQLAFFAPPEGAGEFGQQLLAASKGAATGLVLPPGLRLGGPAPHTNNGHKSVETEGDKDA